MIQLKLITPTKTFVLDPLDGLTIPSNMQLNDNLQHQDAQVSVRVAYDVEVLNSLIENSELQAQLLDNNTPIFSGIIDTGVSWTDNGNPEPLDNIPLVINDNTYKLQQTTEDEFACINISLAEITRRICLNCGLSFEENSKAESVIIPAFVLKAEQEYYQAFSDLLFEYKFTFGFTPDGKLCLIDLDAELDNIELSDLYSGVKVQKTKKKFTGVKLNYGKLTAKENEQIYFEGGNLNEESKVVPYIITPGSYYPVEATPVLEEENGQVYQNFAQGFVETKTLYNGEKKLQRSQNTELIYTTNHYLVEDWTENLSVDRTDFKYTQASVRFYNASDTDAELRQLAIRATAYYRSDAEYILGTGKKYSYDTSYIYDTQHATNFADFLSKYFLGGNLKITFKTDKELTPGQKIKINTNTFSANVKVLAVNRNYTFNIFEITAITEQIVSLAVKKNQTQSSMSADQQLQRTEISAELIDSIIEEYYLSDSRTELINGTWQTTPVVPTNKQYVWTRTTFIYSDGSKTTTEPISVSGASGSSGTDGNSIEYVDIEYAQNQSRTTAPTTSWQTTAPTAKDGYYIWTRTKVKIQNEEATYTQAVCITGDKGATGTDGKNAITMTSATTPNGEYNGQVGIWQGQVYQWNGTSWVLTSGILPTDAVLHYSFDELPSIPDGPAITHLKGNTYNLWQKGFYGNNVQTVSNNNGNIHVVANGQDGGVNLTKSHIQGNSVVIVVKVISGKLFVDIKNKHGMYQELSQGTHTVKKYFSTSIENALLFTTNSSDAIEFEIEEVYIGDASYTTPVIDNSGNNYNTTTTRGIVVEGINNKGLFLNKQVSGRSFKMPSDFTVSLWCKAENDTKGLVQNIINTNNDVLIIRNGATWGDYLMYYIYTQKEDGSYDKTGRSFFPECCLLPANVWTYLAITKKDNIIKCYYNGELKKIDTRETGVLAEHSYLSIGNGSNTRGQTIDDFQIFDRALSDQEVLGLYLARGNTPKQYTINDYRLNLIDDDGIIAVSEKKELLSRWKEIYNAENVSTALPTSNINATGEYKAIIDASTTQGILNIDKIQNYIAATNAIRDAMWGANGYLNNMDTPSTLTGSLDSLFATYRQTAQDANNAISQQQASKASAITVITSNEYTQVPIDERGNVTSYDYSGNTIQVLNGTTVLTPTSASTLADNQYKVTASGTGITAGSVAVGTDKVTIGNSAAMTKNVAEITYTITAKVNDVQFTLYAVQKISKASRGADARIYMLTTANPTVVKSPTGTITPSSVTVEAKSYLGSNVPAPFACDFYFYENNVLKQTNQSVTSASYSPTGNYPVVVKIRKPNTTTTATVLDQLSIPILNEIKGDKGEQGVRGSLEFSGTEINAISDITEATYTITTASTGITSSTMPIYVGDTYINVTTQDVWICSTAGTPTTAKWKHTGRRCSDKDDSNRFRMFTPATDNGTKQSTLTKSVVKGENPFGKIDDLLKITNTNATTQSTYIPYSRRTKIDPKKTYRYVAYIKQEDANYMDYFGLQGYRTSGQYIGALSTGTALTTAYFTSSSNFGTLGRWYMVVGYVVANGTTTAPADSGVYDMVTKQKVRTVTNFQWLSTATAILQMGTLIRYTGSASTKTGTAYLYDVRLDEVNGTEPTLNELLNLDTTTKSKGTWTASTVYNTGDIVYLNGNSYICIANHTSGTSFSTTNWNLIALKGTDGTDGAAGKGIVSIAEMYATNNSSTTVPTTWQDTPPLTTPTNKYLWNYEIITYTDNSKTETSPIIIGVHGQQGQPGQPGLQGNRGPTYKGAFATPPTSDVEIGDWYLDTDDNVIHWYNGSNWNNTVTNYKDYRYTPALNDMLAIAAENPNVGFISIVTAHIQNLAAGNILADEIATKELKLTGDGVIKSENYGETTSGFEIKANGQATFANIETPIVLTPGNICFMRCMDISSYGSTSDETLSVEFKTNAEGEFSVEVQLFDLGVQATGTTFSGTLKIDETPTTINNVYTHGTTVTRPTTKGTTHSVKFELTGKSRTYPVVMVVSLGEGNLSKTSWGYKQLVENVIVETKTFCPDSSYFWKLFFTPSRVSAKTNINVEKSYAGTKDDEKNLVMPFFQYYPRNGTLPEFFATTPLCYGHGAISGLYNTSNVGTFVGYRVYLPVFWANKNQEASIFINRVSVLIEGKWSNLDLGTRFYL